MIEEIPLLSALLVSFLFGFSAGLVIVFIKMLSLENRLIQAVGQIDKGKQYQSSEVIFKSDALQAIHDVYEDR